MKKKFIAAIAAISFAALTMNVADAVIDAAEILNSHASDINALENYEVY